MVRGAHAELLVPWLPDHETFSRERARRTDPEKGQRRLLPREIKALPPLFLSQLAGHCTEERDGASLAWRQTDQPGQRRQQTPRTEEQNQESESCWGSQVLVVRVGSRPADGSKPERKCAAAKGGRGFGLGTAKKAMKRQAARLQEDQRFPPG